MNTFKRFLMLVGGICCVVGVWIGSLFLVPKLAHWAFPDPSNWPSADAGQLGAYGTVGDIFGAINALFSGLALGAIALTLWLESKSRREARKPLVISGIDSADGVVVDRPRVVDAQTHLPVEIELEVQNQTQEAALNVSVELLTPDRRSLQKESIAGPLIKDANQDVVFKLLLAPEVWQEILRALTVGDTYFLTVFTRYRSLEGVNWRTEAKYRLSARSDLQDRALLAAALNGTWVNEAVWDPQAQVSLVVGVVEGSWNHRLD